MDIETKEKQVETAKRLGLDAKNLTSGSVDFSQLVMTTTSQKT